MAMDSRICFVHPMTGHLVSQGPLQLCLGMNSQTQLLGAAAKCSLVWQSDSRHLMRAAQSDAAEGIFQPLPQLLHCCCHPLMGPWTHAANLSQALQQMTML